MVVVVVSLTIPALSQPLDNHRLRRGADQVRARWAQARAKAMEHGRTYVFRYEAGSDVFSVEPWLSGDDYLESDQLLALGTDATGNGLADQTALAAKPDKLPDNVVFVASETTADIRAELVASASTEQAAAAQASPPIFFYPDGTTSTARLMLANQRNRFVTLTLRGLTGVVEVSGLQISEEVQ
jgi:Tfp pilus assembly protein FimT